MPPSSRCSLKLWKTVTQMNELKNSKELRSHEFLAIHGSTLYSNMLRNRFETNFNPYDGEEQLALEWLRTNCRGLFYMDRSRSPRAIYIELKKDAALFKLFSETIGRE
jgi:hypothetical protein